MHRKGTALLFTDQVPVWLKVEAGSLLVSDKRLGDCRAGMRQRRARKQAATAMVKPGPLVGSLQSLQAAEELPGEVTGAAATSYLQSGPCSTDANRWRVTLICKQTVKHYWHPDVEPLGHGLGGCHDFLVVVQMIFHGFPYSEIHGNHGFPYSEIHGLRPPLIS